MREGGREWREEGGEGGMEKREEGVGCEGGGGLRGKKGNGIGFEGFLCTDLFTLLIHIIVSPMLL